MKHELVDAEMLARFANLKPEDAEAFRHSVAPGFVPDVWFDLDGQRMAGWKRWQEMQSLLQDTWDSGFPVDEVISFLINNAIVTPDPDSIIFPIDTLRALPYQRAAMFLFNQSWRARMCNQCRKRFVAHEPADMYCSAPCKAEFRREYKAAHIRERRKREKSKKTKRGGR